MRIHSRVLETATLLRSRASQAQGRLSRSHRYSRKEGAEPRSLSMDHAAWNNIYSGEEPDSGAGNEELFLAVARGLDPGLALDLGCGPGALAIALAADGWTVTAIDFADAAIDLARASAAERRLDVNFLVADVTTWPPPGQFDLVVSAFALPPAGPQRDAATATARAALRPGGVIIVADWDRSMADCWSFMSPDDLVDLDELRAAFPTFTIQRAEVLELDFHGQRADCVFLQAHRPV
jgi:2-polyprenyl-3-methyl-5-hydroxy-6-metoxy-1,4-benzoquinol methylase